MPLITLVTKEKLASIFQPILGEPLTYMMRYFGRQKFDFGVQYPAKTRRGKDYTYSRWRLAISCNWCISGSEGKVVSSEDFGPGDERNDESAYPFYDSLEENPPRLEEVQVNDNGNLRLIMTDDIVLEVIPDHPTGQEQWTEFSEPLSELFEEGEQWRFVIDAPDKKHYDDAFVMTLRGLIEFRYRHVEEFFEAVRKDDLLAVEALLKRGMKPWCEPDSGESTIAFAHNQSSEKMVHLLLEHGIDR